MLSTIHPTPPRSSNYASLFLICSSLSIQRSFWSTPLRSSFSTLIHPIFPPEFTPFRSNMICSLPSDITALIYSLFNYNHSNHAPLCLLWSSLIYLAVSVLIILLCSALSFATLDVIIFFKLALL